MNAILKSAAIVALAFASVAYADDGARVTVEEARQRQDGNFNMQEMDLGSVVSKKQNGTTHSNVYVRKATQDQRGDGNGQAMIVGRNNGGFATTTWTDVKAGELSQVQGGAGNGQRMKIGELE